jgi:hypothetical protein
MNVTSKFAIVAALFGIVCVAGQGTLRAEEASALVTLKPMSGPGASARGQQSLLNATVGKKRAVSYFLNENGLCRVTVMVGEAFNGVDVPVSTTVRFEVVIGVGESACMDTADGKLLEFACQAHAEELTVRSGSQIHAYPSGT